MIRSDPIRSDLGKVENSNVVRKQGISDQSDSGILYAIDALSFHFPHSLAMDQVKWNKLSRVDESMDMCVLLYDRTIKS